MFVLMFAMSRAPGAPLSVCFVGSSPVAGARDILAAGRSRDRAGRPLSHIKGNDLGVFRFRFILRSTNVRHDKVAGFELPLSVSCA